MIIFRRFQQNEEIIRKKQNKKNIKLLDKVLVIIVLKCILKTKQTKNDEKQSFLDNLL